MAEQRGALPDPAGAVDLAEFVGLLGALRAWAGMPSYRVLAKRVGALMQPPRVLPTMTVADAFKAGRRRLDLDLVVAIVRALGLDEPAVDRWRHACIKAHARARTGGPAGVLRQLPADSKDFTGRRGEMETIAKAADHAADAVTIIGIEGMPGVGKSRLALHAAHTLVRNGRFSDVQLYVDLHGFDADSRPADPASVLDGFLRALGTPGNQVPESLEDRAAAFRSVLAGQAALIVLDNAAEENQVKHLIPGSPGALVLLTSRRTLAGIDGVVTVPLDVLSPAESHMLLSRAVGEARVAREPGAAEAVGEACGHLPLAVGLAGARLKSRPAWSVADLLTELRASGPEGLAVGRRSVTPLFDLSLKGLAPQSRRMFLLLGLCPGKDVGAESAGALAGIAPAQARELLEALGDEGLVSSRTAGRFELPGLLRGYAARTAGQEITAPQRWAALRAVLDWYTTRMQDITADRPAAARKLLTRVSAQAKSDRCMLSQAWSTVGDVHYLSGELASAETSYQRATALGAVPRSRSQRPNSLAPAGLEPPR